MTTLNDAVRKLLDGPDLAVLATMNPEGSPQTPVVWVGQYGDHVLIFSAADRRKDKISAAICASA